MSKYMMYIFSLVLALSFSLYAEEQAVAATATTEQDKAKNKEKKEALKEESSITTHTITINGAPLTYTATAGTMLLKDENGDSKASVFYVSYVKDGVTDRAKRPITFCFNGGPGSSAIWLHMGVFGPKRVLLDDIGLPILPYQSIDNEFSILDVTDLVFIDPVSTGYSRPAPGEDAKQFHGVDEDVKSVAQFIHLYVTRNARWSSPLFLAGESYGTTRAAALAAVLHDDYNMYLNGIVLVSSILNFQTHDFAEGNDLPYILYLPTYTATAWYHKKLSSEKQANLNQTLKEVEDFALNEYTLALMKGNQLPKAEREVIVRKLADYTGLSPAYIERANLRISLFRFVKELLREENRTVGRFDSRFKGIDSDSAGETFQYDPSADLIFGAFTTTFNEYVRRDLKWEKDEQYKVLADVQPWNYSKATNKYLNVSEALRGVMTKNPSLNVFVANGYYDLATPYFATDYTFSHLGLDPSLVSHIKMKYYDGGHMMYVYKPSLIKLKQDIANFIKDSIIVGPAPAIQ